MPNNETMRVENSMDLLLVLLYSPGKKGELEPIEGITRLQKLMFLLQQGKGPSELVKQAQEYEYRAYKMGPYSSELIQDLDELKSARLLATDQLEYLLPDDRFERKKEQEEGEIPNTGLRKVTSSRFRLTEFGRQVVDVVEFSVLEESGKLPVLADVAALVIFTMVV